MEAVAVQIRSGDATAVVETATPDKMIFEEKKLYRVNSRVLINLLHSVQSRDRIGL